MLSTSSLLTLWRLLKAHKVVVKKIRSDKNIQTTALRPYTSFLLFLKTIMNMIIPSSDQTMKSTSASFAIPFSFPLKLIIMWINPKKAAITDAKMPNMIPFLSFAWSPVLSVARPI